jgi:hypothetical protein
MRLAILGVVIAYLAVGAADVYWHWYAGTRDTPSAHSLKSWYLYQDPRNGKANHAGLADLICPAVVLGLAAGCATSRQRQRMLVWSAFLLALGTVALMPLYAAMLPTKESEEWWTFASNGVRAVALIPGFFKATLFCLLFGAVGRALAQRVQGRVPDY